MRESPLKQRCFVLGVVHIEFLHNLFASMLLLFALETTYFSRHSIRIQPKERPIDSNMHTTLAPTAPKAITQPCEGIVVSTFLEFGDWPPCTLLYLIPYRLTAANIGSLIGC